ncbi:ZP domain-containing protein-like [Sycon ciliatum]|uniref:ZP domain-containing protein-like n=1 Tax=Sycon ciliatum TaxID=27933 RepID=UPI0031F6870F
MDFSCALHGAWQSWELILPGAPPPPSSAPRSFDVGTPVIYELELLTTHALGIRPLNCWLNKGAYFQRPRLDFIEEGCPVRDSVEIGATQWRNGVSRYQRLSYLAVAFDTEPDDTYYMHCTYRICAPDNNEPCERTCSSTSRKKRQVIADTEENLLTISSEPFKFTQEGSTGSTLHISVTGIFLACVIGIFAPKQLS